MSSSSLRTLAVDLDGSLTLPADPDWDLARQAWNLAVDQRPDAVVRAASVRDVQLVVRAAATLGLRVAPQSTGHNASPMGDLSGTVLLQLGDLRSVAIDPVAQVARVEGGALWGDVTPAAAKHGLVALAGSAPDVGVAGYTLGGGVSWLARSHGLASNSVLAYEVVTADGLLRRVDADHDPDLFGALCGGGGSFGVVTAIEFRLYEISEVYAGVLFFPLARATEVLDAWRQWVAGVPDEVMSVGRMLRFPPLPDLPPFLAGKSFVVVEACSTLSAEETDALLAPLRALGPDVDTFAPTKVEDLGQLHMDPPGPVPAVGDGFLLRELTAQGVESLVAAAGADVDSPLLTVELRHCGGALTPGRTAGGRALDGLDGAFLGFAGGMALDADGAAAARAAVAAVQQALSPWSTGGCYLNFAEQPKSGRVLFGAPAYARLQDVKRRYDADDLIRANLPVRPRRAWKRALDAMALTHGVSDRRRP